MKIKKISRIQPANLIPRHHWRWAGLKEKKKAKRRIEILDGDLILYDRYGKLIVHKGERNGTKEEAKEN